MEIPIPFSNCVKCKVLLPYHFKQDDLNSLCLKCKIKSKKQETRIALFSKIMAVDQMPFPYKVKGSNEKIYYIECEKHLDDCACLILKCPIKKCKWTGEQHIFFDHFETNHPNLELK